MSWTTSDSLTFQYAIVYKVGTVNSIVNPLVGYIILNDSTITLGSNSTYNITFPKSGMFRLNMPVINTGISSTTNGLVKNIYPYPSSRFTAVNSNTGTIVNNVVLIDCPTGGTHGFRTSAGTGICQSNYTIPAYNGWLIFSFTAYVNPTQTGAKTNLVNVGLYGTPNYTASLAYDFDNPVTASTGIFGQGVSANIGAGTVVRDLGKGYYRFQMSFRSTGQTSFVFRWDSSAAADLVTYTDVMLEQIPYGSNIEASPFVQKGKVYPYFNEAADGIQYKTTNRFPFYFVKCFSDSIWGAGTYTKLAMWLGQQYILAATDSLGGTSLDKNGIGSGSQKAVLTRFNEDYAAQSGGEFDYSKGLVIFNGGFNDGSVFTTDRINEMTTALKTAIAKLGHNNYIVCGVLLRYNYTGNNSNAESTTQNVSAYNSKMLLNQIWAETFGDRFFDVQDASVNAYNPTNANDVTSYSVGSRPYTLTYATGDGNHPVDAECTAIFNGLINKINTLYGRGNY